MHQRLGLHKSNVQAGPTHFVDHVGPPVSSLLTPIMDVEDSADRGVPVNVSYIVLTGVATSNLSSQESDDTQRLTQLLSMTEDTLKEVRAIINLLEQQQHNLRAEVVRLATSDQAKDHELQQLRKIYAALQVEEKQNRCEVSNRNLA